MVCSLIDSQSNLQVGECQKWHVTTALLEGSACHCGCNCFNGYCDNKFFYKKMGVKNN